MSIDPNDIIKVADLASVPAGSSDDLVGVQSGRARRFPLASIPPSPAVAQRLTLLEAGQSAGQLGYGTRALMDADLSRAAGALALVTNDPTPSNNGTYRKTGAPGTGSWSISADRVTGMEGRLGFVESFVGAPLGSVLGKTFDTFNRANGAIGTSQSGTVWEVLAGAVSVTSGKASGAVGQAVIDFASPNVDIEARFDPMLSGAARVIFRAIDANNRLQVDTTSTGLRLQKVVAGAATNLFVGSGAISGAITVRVVVNGSQVKVYRDGVLDLSHTLSPGDMVTFGAATKHGIYLNSTARASRVVIAAPDEALILAGEAAGGLAAAKSWLPKALGPDVIAYDGFYRGDGAVGIADSGQAWEVVSGSLSIVSSGLTGVLGYGVIDLGTPDADIAISCAAGTELGYVRLLLRYVDMSNHLQVLVASSSLRLNSIVSGVEKNLRLTPFTATATTTIRATISGDTVRVYATNTVGVLESLLLTYVLTDAERALLGSAKRHGIAIRNTGRVTGFSARKNTMSANLEEQLAKAQKFMMTAQVDAGRRLLDHARQGRSLPLVKAKKSNFGITIAAYSSGLTKSRGGIVAPNGDFIVFPRAGLSTFVIFPAGWNPVTNLPAPIETTMGLSPAQIAVMEITGGSIMQHSQLIISPMRDSTEALIIDWRTRTAYLTNMGVTFPDPARPDKFTGSAPGPNGLTYFFPMSVNFFLEVDDSAWPRGGIAGITARMTDFGYNLPYTSKGLASGCFMQNGIGILPPYNYTGGILFFDVIRGRVWLETFGIDWSSLGLNKFSGAMPGGNHRTYFAPRDLPFVGIYDEASHTFALDNMGLTLLSGGNNYGRVVPLGNGKLALTPAGVASPANDMRKVAIIDPLTNTAIEEDFTSAGTGAVVWNTQYQRYLGGGRNFDGVSFFTPDQADDFMIIYPVDGNGNFAPIHVPVDVALNGLTNRGT